MLPLSLVDECHKRGIEPLVLGPDSARRGRCPKVGGESREERPGYGERADEE